MHKQRKEKYIIFNQANFVLCKLSSKMLAQFPLFLCDVWELVNVIVKRVFTSECAAKCRYMFNTDIHTSTDSTCSCSLTLSSVRTCQR
jgi:hypothetical protein